MTSHIFEGQLADCRADCIVVGLYASGHLTDAGQALDKATGGQIAALFEQKDHKGELAVTRVLYRLSGIAAKRVLVVGLGKEAEFSAMAYRKAIAAAVFAMKATAENMVITLTDCQVGDYQLDWHFRQAADAAQHALFKTGRFKTDEESKKPYRLVHIDWYLAPNANKALAIKGRTAGLAIAAGVQMAREIADLPANICTPTFLAEQAAVLAAQYGFEIEIYDRDEIHEMGMSAFLAVAKGSDEAPKFIVLKTNKGQDQAPIALVGKGITFDSGGISLKPANDMDEMKYDMCGAATVLGVFSGVGKMGLDVNLVGIIPTCENMPSGHATRPGDIVTSMAGKTIEILNTDAEGRLILSDALAYALRFKPKAIIDIATLTGACIVALGYHATGLMTNNDELGKAIIDAGNEAVDRAWQLPLWPEYQEQIKGRFADITNSAGRDGGTITAACFLSRFVGDTPWAHLDVAGTASVSGKEKGATGRPVPLLMTYLINQAEGR